MGCYETIVENIKRDKGLTPNDRTKLLGMAEELKRYSISPKVKIDILGDDARPTETSKARKPRIAILGQ